ncbi:TPA: hypothetical protein DEP96_02460 [Candidatus Uhrbacteria bacterium]|nr:hypothetical protein [Candidatus Uhrbacteria bacterium]
MFRKEDFIRQFPHVHEVHFTQKPDDDVVRSLIDRYFGGREMCSYEHYGSLNGNPHHMWRFQLMGKSDSTEVLRVIEAHLDRDTWCGKRTEPFYFLVRNEEGDDAITLAIAAGLAKFIAKEMGGKLVTSP